MGEKDTHEPIKNEAKNGLKNDRGTLAMARTNVVDSATAQFFINLKDNDFLNHQPGPPSAYGYAVFGKVTEGMDVIDKIAKVKTGVRRPHSDVPVEDVVITSIRRVEARQVTIRQSLLDAVLPMDPARGARVRRVHRGAGPADALVESASPAHSC